MRRQRQLWVPVIGFGERLRIARRAYAERVGERITQADMAEMLGVTRAAYASYEMGLHQPSDVMNFAQKFSKATDCDPKWIIGIATRRPVSGWFERFPGQAVFS